MSRPQIDWVPVGGGRMEARAGGFVLEAWPAGVDWAWSATAPKGMRGGAGSAASVQVAQREAEACVIAAIYPERRKAKARGGSAIAGRGLEGAIEAQAEADRAAGRCELWRVPSPPGTGADARASVVDFFGVLEGGKAVAIEAKEGATASFEVARLAPQQAEVLRGVAERGGLAGVVIELRGRRWWVPWASIAPRVGGGGYLGAEWLGAHGVEMQGADWLSAAAVMPRGEAQGRLV